MELDLEKEEVNAAGTVSLTEPAPAGRRSETELQVCRRLDWRVLLSEPELRRVAYVGPPRGMLVEALKRFSESLTIFDSAAESFTASQSKRAFDVVVLTKPSLRDLEMMRHVLKPGGSVYLESHRPKQWLRGRVWSKAAQDAPQPEEYMAMLQQLGFCEIERHWHRPSFDGCLEIIPLDNRQALEHVFSRRRDGLRGRLKLTIGKYVMKTGWLSRFATCVSIVACKPSLAETSA